MTRQAWQLVTVGLFLCCGRGVLAEDETPYRFGLTPARITDSDADADKNGDAKLRSLPGDESGLLHHETAFRELGSFFNVREANPDTHQGEWLIETTGGWQTRSDGSDDDTMVGMVLGYGLTDDLFVRAEMALLLGDGGGQGNGDINLGLLYRLVEESDTLPAIATWMDMRIPSGDGSSGVDASFNLGVTRSLTDHLRLQFNGMVETLNGSRGDEAGFGRIGNGRSRRLRGGERFGPGSLPVLEGVRRIRELSEFLGGSEPGRRSFRWAVGVGADYLLSERTVGIVNYLNRSNEDQGLRNQSILELGFAHVIFRNQVLRTGVEIGLTGAEDTPNFATKIQYVFSF